MLSALTTLMQESTPVQKLLARFAYELSQLRTHTSLPIDSVRRYLKLRPGMSRGEIAEFLQLEPKLIGRTLELMQANGEALHVGNKRGSRWYLLPTLEAMTKP